MMTGKVLLIVCGYLHTIPRPSTLASAFFVPSLVACGATVMRTMAPISSNFDS